MLSSGDCWGTSILPGVPRTVEAAWQGNWGTRHRLMSVQHLKALRNDWQPQKVIDPVKALTSAVHLIRPVPAIIITVTLPGKTNAHPGAAAEFIASTLVSLYKKAHAVQMLPGPGERRRKDLQGLSTEEGQLISQRWQLHNPAKQTGLESLFSCLIPRLIDQELPPCCLPASCVGKNLMQ